VINVVTGQTYFEVIGYSHLASLCWKLSLWISHVVMAIS